MVDGEASVYRQNEALHGNGEAMKRRQKIVA